MLERNNCEWREIRGGAVVVNRDGVELARSTDELVGDTFGGDDRKGLRQNVQLWIDLRNGVAHRRIESLDALVAGHAQAGPLNFETALVEQFGDEYALGEALSVPLQLSGFRDPGVLKSRRLLEASLPPDLQAIISRAETADPELLRDPTFVMRVAFVPVVPNSGRSPDSIAYFVRPGEVPDELAEARALRRTRETACRKRDTPIFARPRRVRTPRRLPPRQQRACRRGPDARRTPVER